MKKSRVIKLDKREKLIKSAIKLFVKQGFEETPTSQISKGAGVASGTLFYHFNSKEELINGAYLYIKTHLAKELSKDYVERNNFKDVLKTFWISYTKWALKHKNYHFFFVKFHNSKYISKLTQEEGKSLLSHYNKHFEAAQKKGIIKDLSCDVFGDITFALQQIFINEFSKQKKVDETEIEDSFQVIWDAVSK